MSQSRDTYRNPFYNPNYSGSQPVITADCAPIKVFKYLAYKRKYQKQVDYVLNGVCVTMRGGMVSEEFLDNDWHTQDNIKRVAA